MRWATYAASIFEAWTPRSAKGFSGGLPGATAAPVGPLEENGPGYNTSLRSYSGRTGTVTTGMRDCLTTFSATEPKTIRSTPRRP